MKSNDTQLLEEAYAKIVHRNTVLLEANAAWRNVPLNRLQESVSPEVLEELFSGLKSLAKSAWSGVKSAGQAIANKDNQAAAMNAVKAGGQALANKATQVAGGVKSAAQQVGQNTKNIYNTGEKEDAAQQKVEHAANLVNQIQTIVSELIKSNPIIGKEFEGRDPMACTLGEVHNALQRGLESKKRARRAASADANQARETGFLGGVKQAYQAGSTPS